MGSGTGHRGSSGSGWPSSRSLHGGVDEIALPGVGGRLWLCGKHFVGPDADAALAQIDGDAVVCLNQRHELVDRYPGYVAWLELATQGPRADWFPIPDLHAPPLPQFVRLVDLVEARVRRGERVLVHCGAGIGRAGTTAVGVLVRLGVLLEDALVAVREQRPMAGPEAGSQRETLERFAEGEGRR